MYKRQALVIGIDVYDHIDPLKSAVKDAEAIAQYFRNSRKF